MAQISDAIRRPQVESLHVLTCVSPAAAARLRQLAPDGLRLSGVIVECGGSGLDGRPEKVLIADPQHANAVAPGLLVEAADRRMTVVLIVDGDETGVRGLLHAYATGAASDIFILPFDSGNRLAVLHGQSSSREWPLALAVVLSEVLNALPNRLGLVVLATLCGAFRPRSVVEFCDAVGESFNTVSRKLRVAGVLSVRRVLVAGRLIQLFPSLRHDRDLAALARDSMLSTPATLRSSLKEFAGVSPSDIRGGFPGPEFVARLARTITASEHRSVPYGVATRTNPGRIQRG